MVTITIEEEVKLEKTNFKTYNELKKFISSNKSLSRDYNNKLILCTDNEIDEFEKQNTIDFLEKLEEKEGNVNWSEIFIKGTKYNK